MGNEPIYYNGTKILSMKDIDGEDPELYIVSTNRTAGKTTFFGRLVVNKFLKGQGKFGLLYRFNYELDAVADKFFKDIHSLFFPAYEMASKRRANGIYHELFLNGDPCGYAITINSADQIKKNAHLFSDIDRIIFDEFQSETGHYCADEVTKFQSIHKSIARGQGKQVRRVPVYMLANTVSLLNPYYVELGISQRIQKDTKFMRGPGFVLERTRNESAAKAQAQSGFNKAFANSTYEKYARDAGYLNDNEAFIEKPSGIGRYLLTIKYRGTEYAVREYADAGVIYVDTRVDKDFKIKIVVDKDDHEINFVMLRKNDILINNLRYFFEHGALRFRDLKCKEAVIAGIAY